MTHDDDYQPDPYEDENWNHLIDSGPSDDEYVAPTGDRFTPTERVEVAPGEEAEGTEDAGEEDPELAKALIFSSAARVKIKGARWTWKHRIPAGSLTMLAGRESIGKSSVAIDLAAQLTRGELEGRYFGKPQNVVIVATEDSWESTIAPRLMAAKADMGRVAAIHIQDEDGHWRPISMPGDARVLHAGFKRHRPTLVIFDPLMSVLNGKVDSHKQAEVQRAFDPLVRMLDKLSITAIGLIHVNKSGGTDPLNNLMGSKAFATIPRSVLYCMEDPDEEGRFLMTHAKSNLGPKQETLTYTIKGVRFELPPEEVEEGDDPFIDTNHIVWEGEDDRTAAEVLQASTDTNRPVGGVKSRITKMIDAMPWAATRGQVLEALPDQKPPTLDKHLSELVKRGDILRPQAGYYQAKRHGEQLKLPLEDEATV